MSVNEAVLAALTEEISRPGTTTVCADLSEVSFLGSAGLHCFVRAKRIADELNRTFSATGAKGAVAQVLDLTGVSEFLQPNRRRCVSHAHEQPVIGHCRPCE